MTRGSSTPRSARRRVVKADVGEECVFAHFLASSAYDQNLRVLQRRYSQRREWLVDALSRRLPSWRVMGAAGGLHFVIQVPYDVPPCPAARDGRRGHRHQPDDRHQPARPRSH